MRENHQLQLQLIESTVRLTAAEAQLAAMQSQQQSAAVDKATVEQLHAKNRALLQVSECSSVVTQSDVSDVLAAQCVCRLAYYAPCSPDVKHAHKPSNRCPCCQEGQE